MNLWKKVTPIPIEYNNYGYLFECTMCHKQVTYLGMRKYPPWDCPNCSSEVRKLHESQTNK